MVFPVYSMEDAGKVRKLLSGQRIDREISSLLNRIADPKSWDADSVAYLTQRAADNLRSCLQGFGFDTELLRASLAWLKRQDQNGKGLAKVIEALERRL